MSTALRIARDGQRIATFLVCLNDDYDGGETEFSRIGLRFRATCGRVKNHLTGSRRRHRTPGDKRPAFRLSHR